MKRLDDRVGCVEERAKRERGAKWRNEEVMAVKYDALRHLMIERTTNRENSTGAE